MGTGEVAVRTWLIGGEGNPFSLVIPLVKLTLKLILVDFGLIMSMVIYNMTCVYHCVNFRCKC